MKSEEVVNGSESSPILVSCQRLSLTLYLDPEY